MSAILTVLATGPLATVQDLGRPGFAHLGVPSSGAADRRSARLANRLVGNDETAATIEVTFGGLRLRSDADVLVAVSGADATVRVDGRPVGLAATTALQAGDELSIDAPTWGCRNYVSVRGGLDAEAVLGSRSTDTLSGLGPPPLAVGARITVGTVSGAWPAALVAPPDAAHDRVALLSCAPGPRADRVVDPTALTAGIWEVGPEGNRVGLRLIRPDGSSAPMVAHRPDAGELRSEGIAHGSVQIPPTGAPVIFLADHPVTGGYPVIAVLEHASLDLAAQLRPGSSVRFRMR